MESLGFVERDKLWGGGNTEVNNYTKYKTGLAFEKELDDKIIGMLFAGQYTVDQIVKKLNKKDGSYTSSDVSESLERIKLKLSIMNPKAITYPQEYGVCAPGVKTHTNLNLNASEIQKKLGDPENMALLRDVLAKLG